VGKFTRFIIVGLANTISCYFLFIFFTQLLSLNLFAANFLSYLVIIPISYLLYRIFVFQSTQNLNNKKNYFLSFAVAYLANYLLIFILSIQVNFSDELIHIIGMICYSLIFYFLNNKFVFLSEN
jgi:putative flippase GtrA|tara:strand:+ start:538 stop:909 length:372 start_codon:yes stop_codon:yes gene_type:complete